MLFCVTLGLRLEVQHPNNLQNDLGVGIILKGGGTVDPVSKYEIHNFVRANFHSVSDFSEIT